MRAISATARPRRSWGAVISVTGVLLVSLASLAAAPRSQAASTHVFDPVLSLEGACVGRDGVLDPGCPYLPAAEGGPTPFKNPCGVAVDRHGYIYVANAAPVGNSPTWIDIFGPDGKFLTKIENQRRICGLAVDSQGNLYAAERTAGIVVLFKPSSYPVQSSTTYLEPPLTIHEGSEPCEGAKSVAVDPSNDQVYVATGCTVVRYDSAANGSTLIDNSIGKAVAREFTGIDVYGANHDVYVTANPRFNSKGESIDVNEALKMPRMFIFAGSDGKAKCEADGHERPGGGLGFFIARAGIAVDQANGEAYVDDITAHQVVFQFDSECKYLAQLPQTAGKPPMEEPELFGDIAVDDPLVEGEAGYDSPNEGYVYVVSGTKASNSELYAFGPGIPPQPPEIAAQAASEIGETEAQLESKINPKGLATSYQFEYTTESDFDLNGYANASRAPVPPGDVAPAGSFVTVSQGVGNLLPGVDYRFRLVATNHCLTGEPEVDCTTSGEGKPGEEGADAKFRTFDRPGLRSPCPNEGLRSGDAARLPQCRAYELVTPPDTNGRAPTLGALGQPGGFATNPSTADGNGLLYGVEGGSLPSLGGSGFDDVYEAHRNPTAGWLSTLEAPDGTQAQESYPVGYSANHRESIWDVRNNGGSLAIDELEGVKYVRRPGGVLDPACAAPGEPDGPYEFVGCGSIGQDRHAVARWISPDSGHLIFATVRNTAVDPKQLEPNAPPGGTTAVYDRTSDGATHVVSLLPGDVPLQAGEDADYVGSSADGSAVAFGVGSSMYVRLGNAETKLVAGSEPLFGGFSHDGSRLVYLDTDEAPKEGEVPRGTIHLYETETGATTTIGGADSALAFVSPDGSHVYFVSSEELDGAGEGQAGAENLYVWDSAGIGFIAALDPIDVVGREGVVGSSQPRVGGLGQWVTDAVNPDQRRVSGPASDPARSTPDGSVFVFESRADPTDYASKGHVEIYRFDAGAAPGLGLSCVSCNQTGAAATSNAELESSVGVPLRFGSPVNALTQIGNVSDDGRTVFFQSGDRLVARDRDGLSDVYEWQAQGADACQTQGGCLYLISSGHSATADYLYAISASGDDVFFVSSDRLAPQDLDATPSIYDARVDGGFPLAASLPPCRESGCQAAAGTPAFAPPASAAVHGAKNASKRRRCGRGTSAHRSRAKAHCKHKRHKRRHHGKGGRR